MGANTSSPLIVLPPLSDATEDSEDDEVLPLENILANQGKSDEKEEEVSIVFFDEDEEDADDDEDVSEDLYYDDNDFCANDFRCFGIPLFGSFTSQVITAAATSTLKKSSKKKLRDDDDDEDDPDADVESLQLQLKVVDAIYNHAVKATKKTKSAPEQEEDRDDEEETSNEVRDDENKEEQEDDDDEEDPEADVELLQRELEQAEANYVPPKKTTEKDDCDSTLTSDGYRLQKPSSFIDLQQLLFSPGSNDDENSSVLKTGSISSSSLSLFSSSSSTCRIVEIYETRTTQLKPQPEHEKEQVPPERRGVPFRKCRNPSCSCHHRTTKLRENGSRNHRNNDIVEQHHANNNHKDNDGDNEYSSTENIRLKRRSALHRLQKQREKLLAMDNDEDDQTEMTLGSSYSGYSIRSECQINTRMNYLNDGDRKLDHNHRRQRFLSEDYNASVTLATSSHGVTRTVISASAGTLHSDISAASPPSPSLNTPQSLSSTKISHSAFSNVDRRRKENKQQPAASPSPPLPSRRSFGSNHKHTTYPSMLLQGSQSCRKINFDSSLADDNDTNRAPRRCRSEDFIDVNSSSFGYGYVRNGASSTIESFVKSNFSKDSAIANFFFRRKIQSTDNIETVAQISESSNSGGAKRTKDEEGGVHHSILDWVSKESREKISFSAPTISANTNSSAAVPNPEGENRESTTKELSRLSFLHSPTCVMEEVVEDVQHSDSPRSRTTQHQQFRNHQQQHRSNHSENIITGPPAKATEKVARTGTSRDERDDNPARSRLFDESERSLKDYRQRIRFLQNQEKMDRRKKTTPIRQTLKNSRNHQKRKRQQQHQRDLQRAMQLADLYHNMGLIHYQQGRYDTARYVLQCGIDALISQRAYSVPYAKTAFGETTDPFDDDYDNPFYASAPSGLLPLLPTLDEAAPHLSGPALLLAAELVLAQGKIFAAQRLWNETKQYSGKVLQWSAFQNQRLLGHHPSPHHLPTDYRNKTSANSNNYWKDWGPITARAQVLFARCFEREHRPDIAMGYYQEALSVQRGVLGPYHVQVADTLYRIGNLHAAANLLGLAGQCFDEALCLYRRYNYESNALTNGIAKPDDRSRACISADEATVLAGLGWIFMVQHDLERARAFTSEALEKMVHGLGSSHQNVRALKHQLACIQSSLTASTSAPNHRLHHYQHVPVVPARHPWDENRVERP